MSFYSSIYGLTIVASDRIPGLPTLEKITSPPEVTINLDQMPVWIERRVSDQDSWYVSPTLPNESDPRLVIIKLIDHYYFRYADGTEFLVESNGREVWAAWPRHRLTLEDTAAYLLGPIMGFVLLLRGGTCLHGSAIAIGNQAVALVGPAGAGKSTTAAAFANLGSAILTDDIVTLNQRASRFWVAPGYPGIRLWPPSVEALFGRHDKLPRITPTWEKCYLDLTSARYVYQIDPLPLKAIYLLGPRSENASAPLIDDLPSGRAMISLVANTYGSILLDREMRAREFEALSRLITTVAVRHVTPHNNPKHIGRLCDLIVADFAKLRSHELTPVEPELAAHV